MANIAGMEFHFDLKFDDINIEESELYFKQLVSKYANLIYGQETIIHVRFEEGSIKVTLWILGTIYIAIGQYGSFRSGIDYMIKDAKSLKELVQSEIIKNGVKETKIIESKKSHCDPDRIRRVLLAIDRLESKKNLSHDETLKKLSKIRTSISKICWSLSEEDIGLFALSINQEYWPHDRNIPDSIKRYKFVAREEDFIQNSIENRYHHKEKPSFLSIPKNKHD